MLRVRPFAVPVAALVLFLSQGCAPGDDAHVVQVTARDFVFQTPAEIPSGWTTFRFVNEGREHHFFLLSRLPDGKTLEDYRSDVGPAFDGAWHGLRDGSMDKAQAGMLLGGNLPAWYGSVEPMGGVGLIAPGGVGQTTANLKPGTYVMECYVKTADGTFHTTLGMMTSLVVTEGPSTAPAPAADFEISVSNDGIATEGEMTAGEHTVAVHFLEHPELGLGNDVHLVRLEDGTDVTEVAKWMDWMEVGGLRSPAPAQFLGGTEEMPVGYTAYFTVTVEPGRYAWIVEAPAESSKWSEFTVE